MNKFLASLEITFRRDPTNYRPRVNKMNSIKDREQKGAYPIYSSRFIFQDLTISYSLRQLLLPRGIVLKGSARGRRYALLGADMGPRGVG